MLPPYWPTLPHQFHLSPHSNLHEFWLFTVTFFRFTNNKRAKLEDRNMAVAPICFNEMTCNTHNVPQERFPFSSFFFFYLVPSVIFPALPFSSERSQNTMEIGSRSYERKGLQYTWFKLGFLVMCLVIPGSNLYELKGILIVLSNRPFWLNVQSMTNIIEISRTVIKMFSGALLGRSCSNGPSVEPLHSFWASDNEALCLLMVHHRETS